MALSLSGSKSGPTNVPVTTTSGTNVIVPANEAQRLARIGKVQDPNQTGSGQDVTKMAAQQQIAANQLQEGLPQPTPSPIASNIIDPKVTGTGSAGPIGAATSILRSSPEDLQNIAELTKRSKQMGLTPEQMFPNDPFSQAKLKLNLNEEDLKVIASGEAKVSKFSQIVEDLPVVPKLLRKIGISLTSKSRVDNILGEMSTLEKTVKEAATNAATSPQFQEDYLKIINDGEDRVNWLESKIKLISFQSPDVQAEPEEVDRVNKEILRMKTSIKNAKFTAQGIIA